MKEMMEGWLHCLVKKVTDKVMITPSKRPLHMISKTALHRTESTDNESQFSGKRVSTGQKRQQFPEEAALNA
jgi:hypothetical protein